MKCDHDDYIELTDMEDSGERRFGCIVCDAEWAESDDWDTDELTGSGAFWTEPSIDAEVDAKADEPAGPSESAE